MQFTPTWELLRSFGASKFARLSIFVPVFGYFIIFNDAFVSLIGSSMDWACDAFQSSACSPNGFAAIDAEFMLQKLLNIYISLSAIGLSTLIFQSLCPHEIKKFWHVENYVAENMKIFHHEFNIRIRTAMNPCLPEETSRIQTHFERDMVDDRSKADELYNRDILSLWFAFQNTRFSAARWVCFALFLVGVVLLFYPTVTVFYRVLMITMSN